MNYFINLLLCTFTILADVNDGKIKLLIIDKEISAKHLEKTYAIEYPDNPPPIFPSIEKRDHFFIGVEFPKSYDDLQKDMLYMELKTLPLTELTEKYPELEPNELKRLKAKMND